ncbi:MAG TPA: hypothetical protein VFM24_07605 [Nitrospira sp.]|nr:hypothetical protein [Nitrospira sp.]
MSVFCTATGLTGYEPVAPEDLAKIRSASDAMERKELLRRWYRNTLDPGPTKTSAEHSASEPNSARRAADTVLRIIAALAVVFIAAVFAELPPINALCSWIQAREWPLVLTIGGIGVVGFTLMMGGIIKLLMEQDESLSHAEAEDVERSVRMSAQPVTWRATSYRVWGRTAGRRGSEQFSFRELKQAWKSGAVWQDAVWKRRLITSIGALMMMVGLFGSFVVMGPPWIKILMTGVILYAFSRITWGLWRA